MHYQVPVHAHEVKSSICNMIYTQVYKWSTCKKFNLVLSVKSLGIKFNLIGYKFDMW